MEFQLVKPSVELLFRTSVNLGAAINVSKVLLGELCIIPITDCSFEGKKLSGDIPLKGRTSHW